MKTDWHHVPGSHPYFYERHCGLWTISVVGEQSPSGWIWRTSCITLYHGVLLAGKTLEAAQTQATAIFQTHLLDALEAITGSRFSG